MKLKEEEGFHSEAMEKLLNLIGLSKVKASFLAFFKSALVFRKMSSENRKNNQIALNFAFLGNPGTGKTTVARLFAEALHDAEMRQSNKCVETTAEKLKDGGIKEVQKLAGCAQHGVLFIDEAYDLDPSGDLTGKRIVSELLTISENQRDSLSIIIAGYEHDMDEKLFAYNDGLRSRFQVIKFDDFDEQELKQIWEETLKQKNWESAENVGAMVSKQLALVANSRGFGNARAIRQKFEKAVVHAIGRNDFDGKLIIQLVDVIGENPKSNPKLNLVLREINSKIGWGSIKRTIQEFVDLAEKNYERQLNGKMPLQVCMNRLFIGNPGTGKTTCAELFGKILKCLNMLSNGEVVKKTASDFIGSHVGESATKTNKILSQGKGKVLMIDEAYNLDDNLYGKQVLDVLVEKVQGTSQDDIAVLLLGYEKPMFDMLRTQNPGLSRRFPKEYAFHFHDYTDCELLEIFNAACEQQHVRAASYEVSKRAIHVLNRQRAHPNFGNAGAVNLLLQDAISKAALRCKGDVILLPADIETGISTEDPFKPLDKLYNVDEIRNKLRQLQNLFSVAKREGEKQPEIGHFVFRGNPGTGKTTVARTMARILFQMEILSTDRLIETSALELTGEYVGQTKKKVSEKLGEAKGAVLFIDEAYELGKGVYGEEAMTSLLEAMTSPEYQGMVIIIAGYALEIDEMLNRNSGLKSRFTEYCDFKDWTSENALDYFVNLGKAKNYAMSSDIVSTMKENFQMLMDLPGWANGRDVNQLFKSSLKYRASRVSHGEVAKTIALEDTTLAFQDMLHARSKPHTTISKPQVTGCKAQGCFENVQTQANFQNQQETQNMEAHQEPKKQPEVEQEPIRDPGVSDEVWNELILCKAQEEARMKDLHQQVQLAALALQEEKKKAIQEATRQQQIMKQKQLLHQKEAAARRLREAQIHEERKQQRLRQISLCPAGFSWTKTSLGYRCSGGSHLVTNEQLEKLFTS